MRFDLDNPILLVLNRVFNAAVTTMLWILCSLPVVTVGAATAAMYATMMAIAADDCDGVLSKFFASFRDNWKTATLLWVTFIPMAAILAVETGFLFSAEPSGGVVSVVMKGLVVVGLAIFGALWVYSFSGAARLVVTYRQCLSNSLLLALGNPWQTAGILHDVCPGLEPAGLDYRAVCPVLAAEQSLQQGHPKLGRRERGLSRPLRNTDGC